VEQASKYQLVINLMTAKAAAVVNSLTQQGRLQGRPSLLIRMRIR
jgi:hypothetical protein